ncbi:MAG: hypothetical protein K9H65_06995 [Bacteroidales bacterium]|nr:hypothetical protein [Bacteroidales bacterium]
MKHHFTPSVSKDEPNQLIYSPEKDEFLGIEKFSDIFEFLDRNTIQVDDQIMGEVINFAQRYSGPGY